MLQINEAGFVSWLTHLVGRELNGCEIEEAWRKIATMRQQTNTDEVNNLMRLMNENKFKIEAIKSYRVLTGMGLKESKDAVEKYWVVQPVEPEGAK